MKVNPYVSFDGQCRAAFNFYAQVLGGNADMFTWGESPMAEQAPPGTKDRIMHARLQVGGETILMGADAPPPNREEMKGFSVTVNVDEPADAERIFKALAEKGTIRMEIQETFWAQRFGVLTDRFGTPWMINCAKPDQR